MLKIKVFIIFAVMKQAIGSQLLIGCLALLCLSCQSRKSTQEGEVFLQAASNIPHTYQTTDSLVAYRLSLFTAEQEYNFTPAQHIRLKQIQLREFGSFSDELAQRIIAETEQLTRNTDNDTLLCAVRWDIFRVFQMRRDTASALRILEQQHSLVNRLYGEKGLHPYYHAMALMYRYYNEPEQCIYWLQQARPGKESLLYSWYNRISEDCLKAGHYEQALLYADSGLMYNTSKLGINSVTAIVKGEALVRLLKMKEAQQWYAGCIRQIDDARQISGIRLYSRNQQELIYYYASLLSGKRQTQEAIRELEKLAPITDHVSEVKSFFEDINDLPVSVGRLLANCYRDMGKQQLSNHYMHQADSLQTTINKVRLETRNGRKGEEFQSQLLKEQLERQLADMQKVRNSQYLLSAIILLLLIVIIVGVYGWRRHQRRLHELFDLLSCRHTLWLEQHYNPLPLSLYESDASSIDQEENTSPAIYSELYQRILLIMQNEKPFLDHNLDLNTLARHVGTNRTMLSTALNRITGMSFSNWLAEYRVNYLIEQLTANKDKSINELYPLAGFPSRTSFFRQFRQVTGLTPNQFIARLE